MNNIIFYINLATLNFSFTVNDVRNRDMLFVTNDLTESQIMS